MNPTKLNDPLPLPLSSSGFAIQSAAATAEGGDDAAYRAKVGVAAEKFEAFFIAQMLRQMRSATRELADADSPLRNRVNDDMLDLADMTVGEALAGQRAFGIADAIVRQILPPEVPALATNAAGMAAPFAIARDGFNSASD